MALGNKELMAYGKLGAVAGLATGFLLKTISGIVSMVPGVSLDLQSISIGTTGLGGIVNTDLSQYAQKLFGMVNVPLSGMEWLYVAIGGAIFMILGAYLADMFGMLKGTTVKKLTTVMVIAGIASGWILSMSVGIPAISAIVVMVVDAFVLSWILVQVDKGIKTKLVP